MILWLWCEVRGRILGLGVRREEPHFWVVTAVKEPGSVPADPSSFFGCDIFWDRDSMSGGLEVNEAPSSPNHPVISCGP